MGLSRFKTDPGLLQEKGPEAFFKKPPAPGWEQRVSLLCSELVVALLVDLHDGVQVPRLVAKLGKGLIGHGCHHACVAVNEYLLVLGEL